MIEFAGVGPEVDPESVVELPMDEPVMEGGWIRGDIDVLDVRFGSLWTSIPRELFLKLGVKHGELVEIMIRITSYNVCYTKLLRF